MTDERMDPRFEDAVRAALAELEPGEVPVALRQGVTAVTSASGRDRQPRRLLLGLAGLAAAVAIVAVGAALVGRLELGVPTVGVTPSESPSIGPTTQHLELVADDVFADSAAVIAVLERRLDSLGYTDATVGVADGRYLVDVVADDDQRPDLERVLTSVGRVEGLATGMAEVQPGVAVTPDAFSVLFHSEDVSAATLGDDPAAGPIVDLTLDPDTATRFGEYTAGHVGETFAIAIDGTPVVVPQINEAILDGQVRISFADDAESAERARDLVAILMSGPLPSPLRAVEGGEQPLLAPSSPPASQVPTATSLSYVCSRFPFTAALLREGRRDLDADTPWATALRDYLREQQRIEEVRTSSDIDSIPHPWVLVGSTQSVAEFVAITVDGSLVFARVIDDGGWRVDGFGPCKPRFVEGQGLGAAEWVLAPNPPLGPDTQTVDVLVTERACTGSQSADGRIVGPDEFFLTDAVVLVFAVNPLPPGVYSCPGNPPSLVTVTLSEPLGDRRLVDGYANWP
jgi:hypothetical protein